ncbi:MAG: gamma-glutamyltransferase [Cyclobacteriaceae bacterium]|nr:gamma-glutamyltransferase [Cyclobacteriaceae bacterium]
MNSFKNFLVCMALLLFIFPGCGKLGDQTTGLITGEAMVVSAHPLASAAGANMMKNGGNAVDAAIAVQFALAVVYPSAGNIGGGGFMVIRQSDGSLHSLDYREKAPMQAHRKMYQNKNGDVINDLSILGHLAAGVPGSVDGMVRAYEQFGTLPWRDLIQPAIDLAEKGFPLTEREASKLNDNRAEFISTNTVTPRFLLDERWAAGDLVYMKNLANTLKRIRDHGRSGFYEGETADLIISEMKRGNGIINHDDLRRYESKWREPVTANYRKLRIISMGPPSSGGIALIQLLKMIENYEVDTMDWKSENYVHLLVEAEKRVYADRAVWLGDADYFPVPVEQLLDDGYLHRRMADFSFNHAISSDSISEGNTQLEESVETTHFSIVDPWGNAASVTTTLNGSFGAKVVVGGAGFFLNNEMDDFSIKSGFPNMFGLVGSDANAIEPGKRMLSSMTPAIIEKNDSLYMVIGSPGGSRIITSVFQCLLNVTAFKMNMQESVSAPRFHHQWKPDRIYVEPGRIPEITKQHLVEMGHIFEETGSIGSVNAILMIPGKGMEGGADPRGDNTASGF